MDLILSIVTWTVENYEQVLQGIGFFSLVATLTPNKADDKVVQFILDAVNALGANMGRAANAPDRPKEASGA